MYQRAGIKEKPKKIRKEKHKKKINIIINLHISEGISLISTNKEEANLVNLNKQAS